MADSDCCQSCGDELDDPRPGDDVSLKSNLGDRCRGCVLGIDTLEAVDCGAVTEVRA